MKTPFPWYSESRSGGGWFVKLDGEQKILGKHPDDGSKPKRDRDGRWNPPTVILDEFYKLMALRDTASKSDYALETVCALYLMELAETNPDLSKRYRQTLGHFCDFEYRGKKVGKLLVNAELEGIHLRRWAETFPSDQTQRTYINCCKAVLTWAVRKKSINISHNPFLSVKSPRIESRAVVISREEHEALLKFWSNDCYCDFLQAMWFTGARPGEIAKIEARHLEGGLWRLEPTEHKTGRVTGKDRVIGVCDELYEIVDRLTALHPTGPIFRNSIGRPWTTSASYVLFEAAREKKIIRKQVTPYAYRHAWATHALENGRLDIYEVAKALGHQTTQMVMLHYDHSRKNAEHLMARCRAGDRRETTVAREEEKLKLGKGAAFVKSRFKRLRQEEETWEADFRALPKPITQSETHYLGLVVTQSDGFLLADSHVEGRPTVNDLATLLANAMRRPLTEGARRPRRLHVRGHPQWKELFSHLAELGVEVAVQKELPKVQEAYEAHLRQLREDRRVGMVKPTKEQVGVEEMFPAIAQWVRGYGHIEIGDQEMFGFVVRALDYGGLVFEDDKPDTLAEAMAALEKGLTEYFEREGIDLD